MFLWMNIMDIPAFLWQDFEKSFPFKVLIIFCFEIYCLLFIVNGFMIVHCTTYKQWKHIQLSRNYDLFHKSSQSSSNIIRHSENEKFSFKTETKTEW